MPAVDDHTVISIALSGLGGLVAVAIWFVKKKMEAYDEHLKGCNLRNQENADTKLRLKTLEKDNDKFDATTIWIGDCLMTIAAKLNVKLPERP